MKISFLLCSLLFFNIGFSQSSLTPLYIDSLISSESHGPKARYENYEGPIQTLDKQIIGKAQIFYYIDSAYRKLYKVIKKDSLEKQFSYKVLFYYQNKLIKSESWNEMNGEKKNYLILYYQDDKIVFPIGNNKQKEKLPSLVGLSKEYTTVLLR